MLAATICTTLKDRDGDSHKLGPYLYDSEEAMLDWMIDLYAEAAEISFEMQEIKPGLGSLLVMYDTDISPLNAVDAPPVKHVANAIRDLLASGDITLDERVLVAA